MEKHHVTHLESQINELHKGMTSLAHQEPVTALISVIHKPGWTTIAEQAFFAGIVDAMLAQTKILLAMKQVLLNGASKVELNPQPLPPKAATVVHGSEAKVELNPQPLPPGKE